MISFCDLGPIFKGSSYNYEQALPTEYLFNQWPNFDFTYTDT